ncbi:MAG: DNA gyrase subunit A [Oscillospiraceae bacterium]|jgi:DNA gyrase subunit A
MAKKKQPGPKKRTTDAKVEGLHASVLEQPITEAIEQNYMPYAMSVIVSRAIPEIDGFKPSHRKLLYTMYRMNLLNGARTKSANIVGQTMRLNPHGDAAIYETMVRLSRGYEALLLPFVDSKGNFGKVYSRDMAYAASRYTEAKLSPICAELFADIDKETVDFVDNYDGSMKEPTLLPTTFPNVLVSANTGIAVGMASQICGFNLREVCETAIACIRNPEHDILSTMPAPDFPTGGDIIYDPLEMAKIYRTGRGSFKVRARWRYIKEYHIIEIYEIPYSTTVEAIMDKVAELIKNGKVREVSDMRDETDLGGLKLTIDLKRGVDPDKLMQKLYRMTTLEDSFSCNFNILIASNPRVMGVGEILQEWTQWRTNCVRRRVSYDLARKQERLHLLNGLKRILLDIDKAIAIIRGTELEADVIPNLMAAFSIDKAQAEYVAEIRLRNINREYILKRTAETEELEKEVGKLADIMKSPAKIRNIIISELKQVAKKYGAPRKTGLLQAGEVIYHEETAVEDYPVYLFVSREGYFKKITAQSLRMNSEQKYKEGDGPFQQLFAQNRSELLVFTDKQQIYKTRVSDFEDTKASALGVYLPAQLRMEEGETVVAIADPGDYSGGILLFYENGKAAKLPLSVYATKTNRRRLTGAFNDKSPLRSVVVLQEECKVAVTASDTRTLVFDSSLLTAKTTRTTVGVEVMALKKRAVLTTAIPLAETGIQNLTRYSVRTLPAAGALLKAEDQIGSTDE